jgi:hypothetical protein
MIQLHLKRVKLPFLYFWLLCHHDRCPITCTRNQTRLTVQVLSSNLGEITSCVLHPSYSAPFGDTLKFWWCDQTLLHHFPSSSQVATSTRLHLLFHSSRLRIANSSLQPKKLRVVLLSSSWKDVPPSNSRQPCLAVPRKPRHPHSSKPDDRDGSEHAAKGRTDVCTGTVHMGFRGQTC